MKKFQLALLCALVLAAVDFTTASAGPLTSNCNIGPTPSASLLLPYFEVDLDDPQGMSTLMSVGTSSSAPQLARAVLWTDWGIPVASFDLLIPGEGVVSINLRDVLTEVGPPITGQGLPRPQGCADPLTQPRIDRDRLIRQLTGVESTVGSNLCWSSPRGPNATAVGFLTVDSISDCAKQPQLPTDPGYFDSSGGEGLATDDNVLHGDFFLVEPREDFAQGAALTHLPALNRTLTDQSPSFYGFVPGNGREDARRPLSSRYVTRFFNGGAFSGGTELLLWISPITQLTPVACGTRPPPQGGEIGSISTVWGYRALGEEGANDPGGFSNFLTPPSYTSRVSVDESIVGDAPAGSLDLWALNNCGVCSPPYSPLQGIAVPLHSAEGRFSVGLEAIALDDFCFPESQ